MLTSRDICYIIGERYGLHWSLVHKMLELYRDLLIENIETDKKMVIPGLVTARLRYTKAHISAIGASIVPGQLRLRLRMAPKIHQIGRTWCHPQKKSEQVKRKYG